MNAITTDIAAETRTTQSRPAPWRSAVRQLWCLDPDSQVATPQGPRQSTSLREGDTLLGARSEPAEIVYRAEIHIGYSQTEDRRSGWPLQVHPGAFAEGVPNRSMRLPYDASIMAGRFPPSPASALANGATVTRIPPQPEAQRWVVLVCEAGPGHHLIANGLAIPSRTVLPQNDVQQELDALATPRHPASPPFDLPAGTGHAALRHALADRALILGHTQTSDAGIMLRAGDTLLEPHCTGDWCRFTLTPGHTAPPHRVTLLSRHAIPAEILGNTEKRRLGIAISRIKANGREIPLTHWALGGGWHDPEPGWRWTCGHADLLLPPSTTELSLQVANTLPSYNLPQSGDVPGLRTA